MRQLQTRNDVAFVEHRGSGKTHISTETMESRWDAEWASSGGSSDVPDLGGRENWHWLSTVIVPPARVLEAGCGYAEWVAFLDGRGYEAHGIDYSSMAIKKSLASWPTLRLVQGDLRAMPYEDGFFDGIVSFGAIEHDINGPAEAIVEMKRVLRSGGTMYCTVPCMNYWRRSGWMAVQDYIVCNRMIRRLTGRMPEAPFFEYVFWPSEYRRILETAGFSVLKLVPLAPYLLTTASMIRRKAIMAIHNRWPWCFAHMMGAICRKP